MCLIQKDQGDTAAANQGRDKGGQLDMTQETEEETSEKQSKTESSGETARQDKKKKLLNRLYLA